MPNKLRSSSTHHAQKEAVPLSRSRETSYHEKQRLIDVYFATVHVFAPIIHEHSFRSKYLANSSQDGSWLALLNMVFALGSVTSSANVDEDLYYYHQTQQHLSLESFGTGRLETLQALVLMGGLYLHYRNRPNMASAIMGASYRMATGLGLHRGLPENSADDLALGEELKRRNWWTIYVLDTWASVTLGRPSMGIDTPLNLPKNFLDDQVQIPFLEYGKIGMTRI